MPERRRRLSVRAPAATCEPDVSDVHKRAVERALRWAWGEVCRQWPQITVSGSEEQITAKLHRALNAQTVEHRRAAPGLRSFETVHRGAKVESIDGRLELMPDLVFRPPVPLGVRNQTDWGYFIECKIVDGARSIGLYCHQGVARFASGEYAAWMPSGAMLAYVRDGSRPFSALQRRLSGGFATLSHAARSMDVSVSTHRRDALPAPCVEITLIHLWLCT